MASEHFPFMRLPLELRRQVYSYLWLHPSGSRRDGLMIEPPNTKEPKLPNTSILFTSRQIHHEAKDILYREHVFVATVDAQGVELYKYPPFEADANSLRSTKFRMLIVNVIIWPQDEPDKQWTIGSNIYGLCGALEGLIGVTIEHVSLRFHEDRTGREGWDPDKLDDV
ncbi:MAG: hypothetical protein M1835_000264, partial [Candelina submexicana]